MKKQEENSKYKKNKEKIPVICDMNYTKTIGFVEKNNYLRNAVVCFFAGFLALGGYLYMKSKSQTLLSAIPFALNVPKQAGQLIQMNTDSIRDALDTPEENFIEEQTGQEFTKRNNPLFKDNSKTLNTNHAKFAADVDKKKAMNEWLLHQHIQGVSYKDFESRLIINQKVFHLSEVVSPEYHLVWSDIDPVEKKLFFSDDDENLYTIGY